jgi:hypothetical protein
MKLLRSTLIFASLGTLLTCAAAEAQTSPARIDREARWDIVRSLNAEPVFARRAFPMGFRGLVLRDGVIEPDEDTLERWLAANGPAVRPGDRARITNVIFRKDHIIFEINGGPRKKKRWYERLSVGGLGGEMSPGELNPQETNPRGSYVALMFPGHVPHLTPAEVRELLAPVFDFHSMSAAEAYLATIPENVREAIKNHEVLVGMNKEMVLHAKGRPARRIRERDEGGEFEEWIYGQPPQDVEFVRFVGDEVVRLTTMTVTGKRTVKTEREVDPTQFATGVPQPKPGEEEHTASAPPRRPTLRRPGEATGTDDPQARTTVPETRREETEWGKPAPPPPPAPPE